MVNPPVTIPLVKVAMPPRDLLMPALESVLYSGMLAEGEHVYQFEEQFAQAFGLPHALAMSSGTAALHVALLLAGVKSGDEVITTSMTAEPTNTTILQVGARPVFADVEEDNGNLDPAAVEACISPRTRAIVVVHYAGYPARLDALRELADRHGLSLIEDCAHALGARFGGQPIGTIGDFAIFSFQAIKHMTTVDGGVLTMRDISRLAEARRLRWFGLTKGVPRTEVDITTPGFKYNMHNVAAVVGKAQLAGIGELLARHVDNGRYYDAALAGIAGLAPARFAAAAEPSYWLYTLQADDSDAVERCLASIGVMASKLHRPNHYHSVFKPFRRPMPALDRFYQRLVHIPCGWWVSPTDRERIVDALRQG
ncbi:MAG: DegT/DnrJ/EryC1/StrS family aminotransferase [Sphaerotilus natans subsp. sulfidivorans]|jgi:dTDP-4-amino-4,6-dideoxygalactose transaminase|uniref:DegT/DnrJ/EryC1/StrS family aminotransferase n=1 Tax=Sphaerotilus sulfidivorans TaxID=639200 RepID=UPI002355AC27|nr:DegT/DnrJ/EryC1/StrS family aminotransferase [Sphaerotilus sulfidivorans]MCK6403038.1 DegT/DnrJ/EryC1/StrS family aminotransferase [Sphaerotilus sulfidivorans]